MNNSFYLLQIYYKLYELHFIFIHLLHNFVTFAEKGTDIPIILFSFLSLYTCSRRDMTKYVRIETDFYLSERRHMRQKDFPDYRGIPLRTCISAETEKFMTLLPGVFQAKKKDGTIYYRSSITYRSKHISLGSFEKELTAHHAYLEAKELLEASSLLTPNDYSTDKEMVLSFHKWICLINFKNNGFYIKTPIYLQSSFFSYHLSPTDVLLFDADDLFYYSKHSIMRRGNHLFVAEYGMQTNIHSRYGIKNFARPGIDYRFVNGDSNDFRYSNIEILNTYHGVTKKEQNGSDIYTAKIHIVGDFVIGHYGNAVEAAVAYNKAADFLQEMGIQKNYEKNYIESLTTEAYLEIYRRVTLSPKLLAYPGQSGYTQPNTKGTAVSNSDA